MKSSSNETLNFSFRKFCFSYILDLAKILWALRILSQKVTRNVVIKEFWALENQVLVNMLLCSSLLQRVILSIHWYITQNFYPTFFMSVLVRRLFRTAIFSTFSKVAIVTANFMTDFYNSRFAIEISVSTFKETIALVPDYVSETR